MKSLMIFKYSATGNTFVLVDTRASKREWSLNKMASTAQDFSREFLSDGVIFIEAPTNQKTDAVMRFFNPDATRAFCGNATRTVGFHEIRERAHRSRGRVSVLTDAGIIDVSVQGEISRLMNAPAPRFEGSVKFSNSKKILKFEKIWSGCPHAVVWVDSLNIIDVDAMGRRVRYHQGFAPQGTNVDFVEKISSGIAIRTYERGVERETLSCGSGVLAAGFLARDRGVWKKGPLSVKTRGGVMSVEEKDSAWLLGGEVKKIFSGKVWL